MASAVKWGICLQIWVLFFATVAWPQVTVTFDFDEFEGLEFTDSTGFGLQGEIVSSDLSRPQRIPGVTGGENDLAVSFDGQGSLVADDSTTLSLDILPPVTLELWARTTVADQANTAWLSYGFPDSSDQNSGGFRFGLLNGTLVYTLFGVVDVVSEVVFPSDGEWHHVAVTHDFDQGVVHFFLDGEERQSFETTGDILFPDRLELSIGALSPGFLRYIGDVDRIRVSEGVLGVDELDSDPLQAKPITESTLVYFSFNESSGGFTSQGSRESIEAIPVSDRMAEGIDYERIPETAEIVSDSPSGKPGDQAIKFTGQEFALVSDPDGILEFLEDWTLEAWIKPEFVEGRTNAMVLYAYGAPGGGHSLQLAFNAVDPTRLNVRGTAVGILDIPAPNTFVEFDEWQHVAVAHKNGETMAFFLNGEISEVIEYTQGTLSRQNEFLNIGTWPNALDFAYVGMLDRIRFSDRVLNEEEMDSDPTTFTSVEHWDLF